MTTHVICLDGTGQTKTQEHPTNIALIFDALGMGATDGGNQSREISAGDLLGKYIPGVGTQGNFILKTLGLGFGDGLAEQIVRGYTFLSRNYQPGDTIFITGFSRGAAAARALAGFVVNKGLLDKTTYAPDDKNNAYLRAIAAWYDYRSHNKVLVKADRWTSLKIGKNYKIPPADSITYVAVDEIAAIAVFDTVSSLGLPHLDSKGDAVFDFAICDTELNPKVKYGFHALAADEVRDLFGPTYWTPRAGIEQVVFPGVHSNVGGGYPERGLSDGALDWMIAKLAGAGLVLDTRLIKSGIKPNALDVARDDALSWPFRDTPQRYRFLPPDANLHPSLQTRWGKRVEIRGYGKMTYRAKGLKADGKSLI